MNIIKKKKKHYISDNNIENRVIDTIKLHQHFVTLKDNVIQFQKNYSTLNKINAFQLSGTLITRY